MEQELNQDGAVKEPPKETTSEASQPVSTETKRTSERTYSESEWRTMQSLKDKADAKSQRVERELQELRRQNQDRLLADRKRELESFDGDADGQANVRRKHQLQDEVRNLEEGNLRLKGAIMNKYDQAKALVKEHNLNPDDIFKLMDETETETEMRLLAENLSLKTEQKKEPIKEPKPGFKPDSGKSDVGGDDDDGFIKRWNEGKEPPTKANLARVKKIIGG